MTQSLPNAHYVGIKIANSALYLHAAGEGTYLGNVVHAWPAAEVDNAKWVMVPHPTVSDHFSIINKKSALCLNVAGGRAEEGNKVHLWDNPESTHSAWSIVQKQQGVYIKAERRFRPYSIRTGHHEDQTLHR